MTKIGIILGSTRPNRHGEQVATWVYDVASRRGDAEYELVDLRDYQTLRVPMETTEVTDESVNQAILEARRRHSELVDVDRAAQAGDVIREPG